MLQGKSHVWQIVKEAHGYTVRQRKVHGANYEIVGFYRSNCDARRAIDQLYMKEGGIK